MNEQPRLGWEAIRAAILGRITARDWRPGDAIPNEAELARQFGCARATVNRALRDLAEAGLIERRRRAGSRVRAEPVRKATLAIPIIRVEVEASGGRYRHAVLAHTIAEPPASVRGRLGLAAGVTLTHLRTLHLSDNAPFAIEDRWLNSAAVPGAATADFAAVSANEWLVVNAPYTAGDIAFAAEPATDDEAAALAVASGTPVFVVERITWNGATPVTWVRLAHRPGYRMTARL